MSVGGYGLIQVTFRAWNVFVRAECGPEGEWAEGQLDPTESVRGIAFKRSRNERGAWKFVLMCELSPIYTTIILGSSLLNFGTRAVNLGHGLRHLHDKNEFDLFQCLFREGTPERKSTLKILSHQAFLQQFPRP